MTNDPAKDDTIKSVEAFLQEAFVVPAAKADPDRDAAMRSLGRQIGMFILGILDTGVGVQVALTEASVLIHTLVHGQRPE